MLMVAIIQGTVVNLPCIMIRQMQVAASSRRLCLSYGMGLTRIFGEFSIPLEGEVFKKLLHIDIYDGRFLHHMGYRKIGG